MTFFKPYGLFPPSPVDSTLFAAFELRDYQEALLIKVASLMRAGVRRILIQLPTGAGKTVLAAAMHASAARLEVPSRFIVHRKELIKQTSKSFAQASIDHGFIASGLPIGDTDLVTIAGVQTLVNRLDLGLPPGLVVADECHHATSTSWTRVLASYPESFIVGLTATPERLDGKGLSDHFEVMVEGPTVGELIAAGYLSPYDYYAPSTPDTTGLKTVAGDFERRAAATLVDKPKLIGNVVEHYLRLAPGEQGIVFGSSIEHSRNLADAFRGEGVRALHMDGTMPDKEREWADAAFRARDVDVLMNVDLFGEGYDVPGIVYCGLHRITKSLSLHRQQIGRAMRMFEGKSRAVICDHAGNALRGLGLPDDDYQWTLEGKKGAARAGAGGNSDATPIRQCKRCYLVSPSTVAVCPRCATEFPVKARAVQVDEKQQLTKVERYEMAKKKALARVAEERACTTYAELIELGRSRGYENPVYWARQRGLYRGPRP